MSKLFMAPQIKTVLSSHGCRWAKMCVKMRDGGQSPVSVQLSRADSFQFFHLFLLAAGSCPVASKYLWMRSSCEAGRQGWYLLYSMVYSPFPWINNRWRVLVVEMIMYYASVVIVPKEEEGRYCLRLEKHRKFLDFFFSQVKKKCNLYFYLQSIFSSTDWGV